MFNKLCVIVGVIIAIVLMTYMYIQTTSPNIDSYIKEENINVLDVNTLFDEANNGDLIFMSGSTPGENSCKWFTNSLFSHVGILLREKHPDTNEDVLYIWDADLGQKTKDGPRLQPLSEKMKHYKGSRYCCWKKLNGNIPSTKEILNVVFKYLDYSFDNKMISWMFSSGILHLFFNLVNDEKKVFCSELVALSLEKLELLKLKHPPCWYTPDFFFKLTKTLAGEYTDPRYIQF